MDPRAPDPLNAEGDELYSIYRRGIIRRHIAANGRFLESIALESVDDAAAEIAANGQYVEFRHSAPGGVNGPNVRIRIPYTATRYSVEIDTSAPQNGGRYSTRPQLWVPHIAPIKYPGIPTFQERIIQKSPAPWLPQAYQRKSTSLPDWYYVAASSRADNPCYYGGMALAAFALEHLYGVSGYSIHYARKLVEGFLALEMNGHNGYLIRYDRWHTVPGAIKKIRGAGAEELLGLMLGVMFYLKAENPTHYLATAARALRDRILAKVSRGSWVWSSYEHPFMTTSYPLKQFEWALYASTNTERGREWYYRNLLTERAGTTASIGDALSEAFAGEPLDFFDYPMYLTSMILVLEGGVSVSKKEYYAKVFMEHFIKAAYTAGPDRDNLKGNAYMGVVARLCNKYLNDARDSHHVGERLRDCWSEEHMDVWVKLTEMADRRIAACKSLENDLVAFSDEDHWQHNLPLYTVVENETPVNWPGVWKPHNPHRRIGAHFEWHHKYPQWFRGSKTRFGQQAVGFGDGEALDEYGYSRSGSKRFADLPFLEQEIAGFRGHHDFQVEGSGVGLFFLRMLLTHINPDVYPPPVLPDRDIAWPVLAFRGVESLEPKFLNYEFGYRSTDEDWTIEGDKEKAIALVAFPARNLVITASGNEDDRLMFHVWRLSGGRFNLIYWRRENTFDQVVLRKTSSTRNPRQCDILVVADRAETPSIVRDDHWLRVTMYRVSSNGTLSKIATVDVSDVNPSSAQEIDLCIVDYRFAVVTFKTQNDLARVKVLELDFANNRILERSVIDAEAGTSAGHNAIEDVIWIGSAHDRIIINGYRIDGDPYQRLELFSRSWTGNAFGASFRNSLTVARDRPIGAVIVRRGTKSYVVVASYDPYVVDGEDYPRFAIRSWEVMPEGSLTLRGELHQTADWDRDYLLRSMGNHFERLAMSPARFKRGGEFLIAGKQKIGNGKGLAVLYGYVTRDGAPTLLDWNCVGSGDGGSVQMVALCGDATESSQFGAVTASKDKEEGLSLAWWRFGEDFKLPATFRRDPGIPRGKDIGPSSREVDY